MTIGDDDDTPVLGVPRQDMDDIPTKKILVFKCPVSSHEKDTLCTCVCHKYTTIYHMNPCCKPCLDCGFRVRLPFLPSSIEGEDE